MKRQLLAAVLLVASLGCLAQAEVPADSVPENPPLSILQAQPFVGCLSYDAMLRSMPQYAIVEKELADLRQAYDEEMKRVEEDFNQKYEAFLEGRKDFPRTILLKRQTELQQLMQRNMEFKDKGREELAQARKDKLAPLHALLSQAISTVAREHRLALVVNTDSNACPFIEPSLAIDLSDEVKLLLSKE